MAIARRNHEAELLEELPPTLDKPAWRELAKAFAAQVQAIEDAALATLLQRSLPQAEGAQLDLLGRLIRQPREGRADAAYQRAIGARIAVNRSQGSREDLIKVARLALLDSAVRVRLEASSAPGAVQVMTLEGLVSHEASTDVVTFAARAAKAGVRVIVESWPAPTAELLRLDTDEPGAGFAEPPRVDLAPLVGSGFDTIVLAHPDHAEAGLTLSFVAAPGADPDGEFDDTGYPDLVVRFVDGVTTIGKVEKLLETTEYVTVGQLSTVAGVLVESDDDFDLVPFAGAVAGGALATSQDGRETYPITMV